MFRFEIPRRLGRQTPKEEQRIQWLKPWDKNQDEDIGLNGGAYNNETLC